ncbi:MAG: redoxin domain-containing protein [Chloroflexales bacterium]|nr:redoxin domain-containing protein [Chloroflexales bacterium]
MPRLLFGMFLTAFVALVLAACGSAAPQTPAESEPAQPAAQSEATATAEPMDEEPNTETQPTATAKPMDAAPTVAPQPTDEPTATAESTEEVAAAPVEEAPAEVAVDRPAWQQLALTDARTGETFTLADFAGKIVYVEPMATWCSNCRQQLGNLSQARAQLDSDQYAFVALSVETTISGADLAAYADEAGFDWTFAVMTPEALQALTDVFGRTITNPPATPSFIIRADGSTTDLMTGITSPDVIVEELTAIQGS